MKHPFHSRLSCFAERRLIFDFLESFNNALDKAGEAIRGKMVDAFPPVRRIVDGIQGKSPEKQDAPKKPEEEPTPARVETPEEKEQREIREALRKTAERLVVDAGYPERSAAVSVLGNEISWGLWNIKFPHKGDATKYWIPFQAVLKDWLVSHAQELQKITGQNATNDAEVLKILDIHNLFKKWYEAQKEKHQIGAIAKQIADSK